MLDRVVYWLFRLTILLTRPLPLRWGYRVGGAVSVVCYRTIFRGHRKALTQNLEHVLSSDDARFLDAKGAETFRNFAKYVIDFIHFPSMTKDEVRRRLRFEQWAQNQTCEANSRGSFVGAPPASGIVSYS